MMGCRRSELMNPQSGENLGRAATITKVGLYLLLGAITPTTLCMRKNQACAGGKIATPKAKGLEGRHRNFRTLVRIWESPRARNSRHRNRQELFGSLDPALTNLVHAASSVL
jgi:hypothetical protein